MLQNTDYKPRVDHEPHKTLETRVKSYLEERGYYVHEATYHATLPEKMSQLLSRRFDMTSLYLRARADRIALHLMIPVQFEWEVKTHANPRYNDLTIELLPLAHHMAKAELGVQVLYVFNVNGREGGFWVHKMPPARVIFLPPRAEYNPFLWHFRNICAKYFRNVPVQEKEVNGSRDPFVIFDKAEIAKLRHWQDLIDEVTK